MAKPQKIEQRNPYIQGRHLDLDITDENVGSIKNVFSDLPSDLVQIQIRNYSKSDFKLKVPESIGSLSNLGHITFHNCVNSIPNSVCQIPKLRFLALTGNKELRNIPECVNNMESLYFLNLKDSNVETPIMGFDFGGGQWDMSIDSRPVQKSKEEELEELRTELLKIQRMIAKLENS
jgi:hypothetical protein